MALSTEDKARIHEEAREWTVATRQIRRERTPICWHFGAVGTGVDAARRFRQSVDPERVVDAGYPCWIDAAMSPP